MKKTKKLNTAVLISGVHSAALYTLPAQSQPVDDSKKES